MGSHLDFNELVLAFPFHVNAGFNPVGSLKLLQRFKPSFKGRLAFRSFSLLHLHKPNFTQLRVQGNQVRWAVASGRPENDGAKLPKLSPGFPLNPVAFPVARSASP